MTGTGTQTDPYIPETWDEFVTAIGTSGAYVSLPEGGGTFDMNDIAPEGGTDISIECNTINGNDWEIKNAYNMRFLSGFSSLNIDRLHFLDFYYGMDDSMFNYSNSTNITGSKFSGIIAGGAFAAFSTGTFRRCSANLKLIDNAFNAANNVYFYFSKIIIDHSDSISTESDNENVHYYNSFIEHKASADKKRIYINGKSSILHSDAGNYITTSTGSEVSVTEEQLRDAAYLRSIGFPIAGGSR